MAGIPGEAETSRNEHHAWTAACLCRSIRAPLPTTFEGRRRTWREIGDRLSRFAGVGAHRIGHGDRIAVLMLKPGSLHIDCYLTASWAGIAIVPPNIRWSIQDGAVQSALTPRA
jgi:hypothetical protein